MITINYREAYGIYACNGILFNHESPKEERHSSQEKFHVVFARIKLGVQDCLYLGNLNAKRDCGHAKDYVEMQWLMLQQQNPDDYVIATGEQHSIKKDFVNLAGDFLGMNIYWKNKGMKEVGYILTKIRRAKSLYELIQNIFDPLK